MALLPPPVCLGMEHSDSVTSSIEEFTSRAAFAKAGQNDFRWRWKSFSQV
jgi:hypothetical protein